MSAYDVIAAVSVAVVSLAIVLSLTGTSPIYRIASGLEGDSGDDAFLRMMEALTDAKLNTNTKIDVLTNGEEFYPAELEAIRNSQRSVNLEAYIFQPGIVTREMVSVMAERARAGVKVRLVVDAVGTLFTRRSFFKDLIDAGGRVESYHPISLKSFFRLNNRTHRELLIVDGVVGFIGGAGIADQWRYGKEKHPRWRDTMVRVEGDAVSNLQATFAENWCECAGEVLTGGDYFPIDEGDGSVRAMVVNGSPNASGFTRSRVLFQALMASAQKSIHITTPYFLPDKCMRGELVKAIRDRGVEVVIIVPGAKSDHLLTRTSSRMLYGDVLRAGGKIYEYQAAMIHAKILLVDGLWAVVGSTNCDPRSFGLNDEVNMAIINPEVAARLERDFASDLRESRCVTLDQWSHRPWSDRAMEVAGFILRKEQ